MKRLRCMSVKPMALAPVWPNAGVCSWYECALEQLISAATGALISDIAAAWAKTPPIFHNSHITMGYGDAALHAAGVVFRVDDVVLLMRREDGEWAFPGGKMEDGEDAEAAARREAFEETLYPYNGLLEPYCVQEWRGVRFAIFIADLLEGFAPQYVAEHTAHAWVTIPEALELKLHPGVRDTLKRMARPVFAQDAPSPTKALQAMLAKWGTQTIKRFDLMSQRIADDFAARNQRATQAAMMAQLKRAGFTVKFKPTRQSMEALRVVIHENIGLIKSIPRKFHGDVQTKVWNAVRNGSDLNTLSKELRKTHKVTVRRAALIARDQNAKAKAVIERVRQQELGINRGVWMHSHAGKEPRPTHVDMDGRQYDLAKGMWDSDEQAWVHPGELINCRCTMRPIIEGFED